MTFWQSFGIIVWALIGGMNFAYAFSNAAMYAPGIHILLGIGCIWIAYVQAKRIRS